MRTVVALSAALLAACTDPLSNAAEPVVRPEWVTGEAAAALDSTGRFRELPGPDQALAGLRSRTEARDLALAYVGFHRNDGGLSLWELDLGEPIDFSALRICDGPVYSAAPTIEPAPLDQPTYRNFFAPKWLTLLCNDRGRPLVQLTMSALTPLRVRNGVFDRSVQFAGDDFRWYVVRPGRNFYAPLAEEAVQVAFRATGRRVRRTPVLQGSFVSILLPDFVAGAANAIFDGSELYDFGRWRLELESPVRLRLADGRTVETATVYVPVGTSSNVRGELWVPAAVQPDSIQPLVQLQPPNLFVQRFRLPVVFTRVMGVVPERAGG